MVKIIPVLTKRVLQKRPYCKDVRRKMRMLNAGGLDRAFAVSPGLLSALASQDICYSLEDSLKVIMTGKAPLCRV